MASCVAQLSLYGVNQSLHVKANNGLYSRKLDSICKTTSAKTIQKKPKLSVSAGYREGSRRGSGGGGGGGDFVAGFLLGGAVFGAVAYIFAPQIQRSLMSEDEYGFKKPQQPTYYDEGLEKTRETLNEKIGQLNSAIDNVSSRLRGRGQNTASSNVPVQTDPEVEATT